MTRIQGIAFFVAGFVFDMVMLGRIDSWHVIGQQIAYLAVITCLMARMLREEGAPQQLQPAEAPTRVMRWYLKYRGAAVNFCLGTLLNVYTIFFFKSSSLLVSFGFMAVLVLLLIANETPRLKFLGLSLKFALLALCFLCFFAWLFYSAYAHTLGANPAEALIRSTGDWTLRFLCITLAVTPFRQWTKQPALARFRRMLGLFAFFYAVLHFLSYSWLDMGFDLNTIVHDIPKRPFALVGFTAFVLLIPLAATSFNRAIKALGAKRWQTLHRLVYATVLLGLLHFFWMKAAKNNFNEVAIYAIVIAFLLGWRVHQRLRRA